MVGDNSAKRIEIYQDPRYRHGVVNFVVSRLGLGVLHSANTLAPRHRVESVTFLFDILPLARLRSFGDSFREESHELCIAGRQRTGKR